MTQNDKNQKDLLKEVHEQREGDIFLKHDDDEKSTAIVIRENSIVLHTGNGDVGLLIKSNGDILCQGRINFKVSGFNIIKQDELSEITENPLAIWVPSTTYMPVLTHLRKFPDIDFLKNIKDKLDDFLKLFTKRG